LGPAVSLFFLLKMKKWVKYAKTCRADGDRNTDRKYWPVAPGTAVLPPPRVHTHTHTCTYKYSNPELYAQAHADSSHKTQFSKREREKKEKKTRGGAKMSYVV
jgi:hypothetical protein